MIGRLRGVLAHKQPPQLLIEVCGVGYEVEAPMSTFYVLPGLGEEVLLYTHLHIREDAHQLFGFAAEGERALFRELLKVNGVGARVALAILSGMDAVSFTACIHAGDSARLTRLPGIGKKTAERLIIELRDRLATPVATSTSIVPAAAARLADAEEEAVSALVALGYRPPEASRMIATVAGDDLDAEAMIRLALRAAVR
ncbi:Holliday junction DNA helicase RuvA [Acidihalobacter yilgarnensis]|uniref:Holliday junction branch migration complex subunit RuvA n=1 Tax=Acidihalobacter yilgarnensis TaxID=2819280 RepID=A0A1D8IR45_9GAMM|nr:Holliday junction branch migration protein RuvA [Acidihalobacter yilgarnensis]AOU98961.1 Holliday junction DNA helicase RuvA [Acidihalobacter yilgarnensis]